LILLGILQGRQIDTVDLVQELRAKQQQQGQMLSQDQ
jgi:hypothetical protein